MTDWNIELDKADHEIFCPGCAKNGEEVPIGVKSLERMRNRGIQHTCIKCMGRFAYTDLIRHQPGGLSRLAVHGAIDPGWLEATLKRIDDRPVIVSVSGGKDSTAVALLLKEAGIPFTAIHFDTGWEHPLTDAYVREVLPPLIGPVEILKGKFDGFADMVRKKGMFPSRIRRFCTFELKVKPFIAYLKQRQLDGDDPISVVGIRAAESRARAGLEEWEENDSFDCEVWRPIIKWSYQDVIDMHLKHNVVPNALYLKGMNRVGCWPCIFSPKKEIRLLSEISSERAEEIEALEKEVQDSAEARYAARGETFESLGYAPPTMFMPRTRGENMPFTEVVAWSKTARGGKYLDPQQTEPDAGCMRWGMCDQAAEDKPESPGVLLPLAPEGAAHEPDLGGGRCD